MVTHPKNNSGKKGNKLFGKRSFIMYGLLALVVVTVAAAAMTIAPGGSENSSAAGMWTGAGTFSNPYQIGSVQDLANLADDTNGGVGHSGEWFVLTTDLDLNVAPWTPIGNYPNSFYGNFNGNGHTISNLFINNSTGDNIGLFGFVTGGIIENLGVVNVDVTGDSSVGGLVGYNNSTIENCYVIGTVSGSVVSVGGVAGASDGTIENCYHAGGVNGSAGNLGGVVGNNNGTVDKCYNTGAVNGSAGNIGGVVGGNGGPVENSYNTGDVTQIGGSAVGGVVGKSIYGTVEKCYNTGAVKGNGDFIGGLAGYIAFSGIVENCYNTGDVTQAGSGDYIGGVVGFNDDGSVENCYNTGAVDGGSGDYIGGVVGSNSGTVENCFFLESGAPDGIGNGGSGATSALEADLQALITFPPYSTSTGKGWDFAGIGGAPPIWFMLDNATYPMLFWQIADSGSGSDTDPYVVTTVQQMENIQNIFVVHEVSDGKYWQLDKDIDLTGYLADGGPGYNGGAGWVPIGYSDSQHFYGSFDGNGHTITGLSINDTNLENAGMFGYVINGVITDLGLVNANVTGGSKVGGVVGYIQDSSVKNCFVSGTSTISGIDDAGGVVGFSSSGTVENCYNTGEVHCSGSVGGVVGYINSGSVENCYNTGDVSGADFIGGVVGNNSGIVKNCYNIGSVTNSGIFVGGVVGGSDSSTVSSCFFLHSPVIGGINYGLYGIGNVNSITSATDEGATPILEGAPASTFTKAAGWDFDKVWGIFLNNNDPGKPGYGYPYLKTIENYILIVPSGGKVYDGNPPPADAWSTKGLYNPDRPLTVTLTYDPPNPINVGIYSVTVGVAGGSYYQLSIADAKYVISAPGTNYTIAASSDADSVISPSGQVSVQGGTSMTFTYSPASGYHISSVTVNGKDLTQDQITGSYTFTNVMSNNSIAVKSASGAPITLTISIVQGSGYAEYSVNGSDFIRYTSPVPLNVSDSVTVRADAADGYSFVKWETPSTETNSEVTLIATSSLSLKAYFSEGGITSGNSSNSNLWIWVLAVIVVLIIIGIIIWYLLKLKK